MRVRLVVVVGFLGSLILLGLMLAPLAGQPSGYNPWLDSNDDGVIDVLDLQALGAAYGSSGAPLNMPMALEYDSGWLDISDMQGQNVTVTHNLNLATDFVQTVYGKTLPESGVHQKCFDGSGYAPGWNETYDSGLKTMARVNIARSVVQTSDGGYAMAGFAYNATNNRFFWLVKTDSYGNHLWNQTYGESNWDRAYSLIKTGDGGYALAGTTVPIGVNNFWLVKVDASGNMQWSKTYGDEDQASQEVPYSMVMTSDGGFAIAGFDRSMPYLGWLVKTDAFGLCRSVVEAFEFGLAVIETTANTLTIYRGKIDPYWNYVRVRIWVAKQSP